MPLIKKEFFRRIAVYIVPFIEKHPDFSEWREHLEKLQSKDFSILQRLDQKAVQQLSLIYRKIKTQYKPKKISEEVKIAMYKLEGAIKGKYFSSQTSSEFIYDELVKFCNGLSSSITWGDRNIQI